jgi:S1-C subfamily serine protease
MNIQRKSLIALAFALALSAALSAAPSRALEKKLVQKVSRAAVQLGPVAIVKSKTGKKELKYVGWGSGTLLPGGFILTNQHVSDVSSIIEESRGNKNIEVLEDKLVVMLTKRTDEPPIATYIADIIIADENLDLAVLRIAYDLSGQEIDPADLDLPFIELGDSDTLDLGDKINIFGYPGIGGDTITFTSGNVSGFSSEGKVSRGWIKTDATIAGGNSGGTGVNDQAELVGIPTRGGSGNTEDVVDCRPVADTNQDGAIDESDTCVPMGGFINSLRPVNLATPLIEEAMSMAGSSTDEPAAEEGVLLRGTIVDAATGKPIAGAVFIVLNEGLTWETAEGTDEEIYEQVVTDRKGYFETTLPLQRGGTYSVGYTARNYEPQIEDGVEITDETADVVDVKLSLQRK